VAGPENLTKSASFMKKQAYLGRFEMKGSRIAKRLEW
jgi:hypothetical protein